MRIAYRGKGDEVDAAGESRAHVTRDLQSQPGFTDAREAEQGNKAHPCGLEEVCYGLDFGGAANEAGGGHGEVGAGREAEGEGS